MKRKVYITRHGQTAYNLEKRVQGSGIDSSLNDFGDAQAAAFFEAFKSVKFDAIYASALQRSYQSIKRFETLGYEIQRFEELNEISWGIHEGQAPNETMRNTWLALMKAWDNGEYSKRIEGGESADELAARMWAFVKSEIFENKDFDKILICSHGRSIRALLCVILNLPLSEMGKFEHHNMNLYLIEIDENGRGSLLKENEISHLPAALIHG